MAKVFSPFSSSMAAIDVYKRQWLEKCCKGYWLRHKKSNLAAKTGWTLVGAGWRNSKNSKKRGRMRTFLFTSCLTFYFGMINISRLSLLPACGRYSSSNPDTTTRLAPVLSLIHICICARCAMCWIRGRALLCWCRKYH